MMLLKIEPLFTQSPNEFAHPLLPRAERQKAAPGDWAKVVVEFSPNERKQMWLEVVSVDTLRPGTGYVGQLPGNYGYPEKLRQQLGRITFEESHVYRLLKHNVE